MLKVKVPQHLENLEDESEDIAVISSEPVDGEVLAPQTPVIEIASRSRIL